ncbi:carbonic anhydrase 2 [Andrena cerasifolii]|uniref:carbonic anhydrase 2 n=1 Tax=Andrena cerasifolii TaxID=2819439 RepID=UPI004037AF00
MSGIVRIIYLLAIISLGLGHFGYSNRDQHVWVKKFKSCGGKLQSPISISSSRSLALPLPALEVIGYHNFLPRPLSLKNTGHSVEVDIDNVQRSTHLPYIYGAALKANVEYVVDHLHFHWGAKNNRGSEHVLNGVRYPMEMHIVHRNKAYSNFSHALNYEDGLVVLGIFFQLQEEDNKLLSPILNDLINVKWLHKETTLDRPVTLASLLPRNTDVFYTYKGSLTTPPCSEVVTWIIFSTPTPISFTQINKFRPLSNGEAKMADNFRILQHVGLRKVYVRRLNSLLIAKYNGTTFNSTNLEWFWR